MNDQFAWWLLILGIGIGVGLVWLVMGRLPRADDDIDDEERELEAAWISRTIATYGGDAPEPLVEEILELHRRYLEGPAADPSAVARSVDRDAFAIGADDEDEPSATAAAERAARPPSPTPGRTEAREA